MGERISWFKGSSSHVCRNGRCKDQEKEYSCENLSKEDERGLCGAGTNSC